MWKHAILVEDLIDAAPLVLWLFTGRTFETGGYVSIISGSAAFPAVGMGGSAKAALDDAVSLITAARRYRVVREQKQVGQSYIRAIRWDEGPLLVHFQSGAPIGPSLLAALNGSTADDARRHVATAAGSPLFKSWGTDETLGWEHLPADIARISSTTENDLDLRDDDFWQR